MDDSVIASIARWPNVPHVYGWLSLDRRGRWCLEGSPITNLRMSEFIARNYASDERGAWFFQNGPQRVYVALDYTPWILRIGENGALGTHIGQTIASIGAAFLDEAGNLLLAFGHSVGLVEDRDLHALLDCIRDAAGRPADEAALSRLMAGEPVVLSLEWDHQRVALTPIAAADVAARFGFIAAPCGDEGRA